jgi:hypothetical protein
MNTIERSLLSCVIAGSMIFVSVFQINAQTTIQLKGVVTDTSTASTPIASAVVKLIGSNITTVTGADGKFTLSSTGVKTPLAMRTKNEIINIVPSGFSVLVNNRQNVTVSIYDATGKTAFKHAQTMMSGYNFIRRPGLSNGIYIVNITMEQGTFSQRFIYTNAGMFRDHSTGVSKQPNNEISRTALSKTTFSDTLLITAANCLPVKKAISSAIDSGIIIRMIRQGGNTPYPCGQEPCDPKADSKARNLLCYLKTHAYISGQTDIKDCDWVKNNTGRYPAICAFDGTNAQQAIDWAKSKKGIIAWQWHWNCPYGGNWEVNCDYVKDLDNPNSKLWSDIDEMMKAMKQIGDAGYPVIFRPLHESNNNWMWWARKDSLSYKKLWRLMYKRAQVIGTHNLLWCFNGMASGRGENSPMRNWYPGDDVVDIISSDYAQNQSDFNKMDTMGNNKVLGIAETWMSLIPSKEPPFSFSVVWASRDWAKNNMGVDVPNYWKSSMKDPKTISIDQLPDMSKW